MKWKFNTAGIVLATKFVLAIAVVLALAPGSFGRQTNAAMRSVVPSAAANGPTTAGAESPAKLVIGPGDLLTVSIFNIPELLQTVRISETGDAVLSLIGNIHLADMTVADAEVAVENEYRNRKMLVDPHVNILVTDYATEGVSVLGEVTKPGVYPLMGPHTLLDIISAAGGLTGSAGNTVSIRRHSGEEQIITLDANDPHKALARDVELHPSDMVIVARAAIIYVVGDVSKPGGFPMQNNGKMTVLQAIAMASGVNKTASLSHAKIIHKDPTGYKEADIHLAKLLEGKAPDRELEPEDIVFVPNSKLKSAVAGGYSSALSAATTAIIYTIRP
ncbi:MAG TPA: polysaccharide biosynthesis/export family protein [Candidatus Acidoferrales bacterium]